MTESTTPRAETPLPVPEPDDVSEPFWAAAAEHRLVIQKCSDCGRHRHFPRPGCPSCGSLDFVWDEVSGRGRLYSWVVAHKPTLPAFADRLPMPVVLVELDDTDPPIRLVGGLRDAGADDLDFGIPMEVVFEDIPGDDVDMALPHWRVSST